MDIIMKAREFGKALQECDEFIRLNKLAEANAQRRDIQEAVRKFGELQHEAVRVLKDQEDNKELMDEYDQKLNETYDAMMSFQEMVEFKAAQDEFSEVFKKISAIIERSIHGEDPFAINFDSCTHNCSTCGGCQ